MYICSLLIGYVCVWGGGGGGGGVVPVQPMLYVYCKLCHSRKNCQVQNLAIIRWYGGNDHYSGYHVILGSFCGYIMNSQGGNYAGLNREAVHTYNYGIAFARL